MKSHRASLISVNSDHDQCRKKNVCVKSVSTKKQANMDHIIGDKIPRRFVFSRCKLPGPLKQLQADLRKLVLPYTAFKLKNNLRDFLNVVGPMGVTHFLMLSKTPTAPYLRPIDFNCLTTTAREVRLSRALPLPPPTSLCQMLSCSSRRTTAMASIPSSTDRLGERTEESTSIINLFAIRREGVGCREKVTMGARLGGQRELIGYKI
ncbi:peter Pan-like protein [Pyrus ussuriensis x Pyrus communis]|uniref:Peter Pan-like protein n=1 Tax=Pyrus ussuriensis x Pyrus communis TaxID=2448454 RepID=A0A5N5FH56_9ROSA|nr:peter Pan-like protein [Pyrus ussuriensis x Pyrus communis]